MGGSPYSFTTRIHYYVSSTTVLKSNFSCIEYLNSYKSLIYPILSIFAY